MAAKFFSLELSWNPACLLKRTVVSDFAKNIYKLNEQTFLFPLVTHCTHGKQPSALNGIYTGTHKYLHYCSITATSMNCSYPSLHSHCQRRNQQYFLNSNYIYVRNVENDHINFLASLMFIKSNKYVQIWSSWTYLIRKHKICTSDTSVVSSTTIEKNLPSNISVASSMKDLFITFLIMAVIFLLLSDMLLIISESGAADCYMSI